MSSSVEIGHSQKLLRCQVESKNNTRSYRYVELEHYKFWSYMMFHKHGLRIIDLSLWLWIKEDDFRAREDLYRSFPEVDAVNKIELFLFDEQNGFSHTTYRYVGRQESENLENILFSHLSQDLITSGNYEIKTHAGFCIKSNVKNLKNMILGLSGNEDRIWYREN